jgi:hypothetical protein
MKTNGMIVGILTFLFVRAIVNQAVTPIIEAGDFPGLVAAIWAAWPFFYRDTVERFNLLHPVSKQYSVTSERAFRTICGILNDKRYGYGDKWQIINATEEIGQIIEELQFVEERSKFNFNPLGKKEPLKRYIKLEVQIRDAPRQGTAIVRCDFGIKADGSSSSCDSIVKDLIKAIEAELGSGVWVGQPKSAELPLPSRWLLGVTMIMLFFLLNDVIHAVYRP